MRISTNQIFQQGLSGILQQQARLSQTQLQLSTGKRINSPADDPVGSARLQELERAVLQQGVFDRNVGRARQRLEVAESSVASSANVIQRVRELTVQASNDTLNSDNRAQVAVELRQRLDQLIGIANTRDGDGEYIFAGAQAGSRPFVESAGQVVYVGDSIQRELAIAPGVTVRDGEPGDRVFMAIRDGNGVVRAEPAAGNAGSGFVNLETRVDRSVYDGDTYTIEFVDADSYVVRDGNGDLVVGTPPAVPGDPPIGEPFSPGETIEFAGLGVVVRGAPAAGDEFVIEPARNQSVFATLGALIDTLEADPGDPAAVAAQRQGIDDALAQLERIEGRLIEVRADIGGRQKTLDDVENSVADQRLSLESLVSEIRDLDYAEAITRLQQELVTLQAAQQSFARVQGLSLFQFLR